RRLLCAAEVLRLSARRLHESAGVGRHPHLRIVTMSTQASAQAGNAPQPEAAPQTKHLGGLLDLQGDGYSEKLVDAIEMLGEEKAAGLRPAPHSEVTPG